MSPSLCPAVAAVLAVDVGVPEFEDPSFYASCAVDPFLVAGHNSSFDRCQGTATLVATDQVSMLQLGLQAFC